MGGGETERQEERVREKDSQRIQTRTTVKRIEEEERMKKYNPMRNTRVCRGKGDKQQTQKHQVKRRDGSRKDE